MASSHDSWIDSANDLVYQLFSKPPGRVPFTNEQTALLQELLKQAFEFFGKELGNQLATKFVHFDVELEQIRVAIDKHVTRSSLSLDPSAVAPSRLANSSNRARVQGRMHRKCA